MLYELRQKFKGNREFIYKGCSKILIDNLKRQF